MLDLHVTRQHRACWVKKEDMTGVILNYFTLDSIYVPIMRAVYK